MPDQGIACFICQIRTALAASAFFLARSSSTLCICALPDKARSQSIIRLLGGSNVIVTHLGSRLGSMFYREPQSPCLPEESTGGSVLSAPSYLFMQ